LQSATETSDNIIDVILTNGWDRIGYNVLRGLAKENLKVAFGTDSNSGMGRYSHLKSRHFIHSDYSKEPQQFIGDLKQAIIDFHPKVYIPTGEEAYLVSQHLDELIKLNVKIPISSFETLNKLNDKSISHKTALNIDVPHPKTITPKDVFDIINFGKDYGYPLVLKVNLSNSAKGVYFISKSAVEKNFNQFIEKHSLEFGNFIVQQFVNGSGYGVSLLMNHGIPRAIFTHKKLRERIPTGGPSTLRISAKNPLLEEYARSLLKSVDFHGVAMVEFKYDEEKKQGWFIEVNPRFWGSVGLAINSGVNFPYLLYKMALDGDVEETRDYQVGVKCKWLLGDLSAALKEIYSQKNLHTLKNIFNEADYYDDFYRDDPLPFFAWLFLLAKRKFNSVKE